MVKETIILLPLKYYHTEIFAHCIIVLNNTQRAIKHSLLHQTDLHI